MNVGTDIYAASSSYGIYKIDSVTGMGAVLSSSSVALVPLVRSSI